jgi:hypothetical protein
LYIHIYIYMYTYMHIFLFTIRTRLPNIGSFVGVFVQHTQLTTTTIRQREDSCMNLFFELLHYKLRCVACPVVPIILLARERLCRDTARWWCSYICV